MRFIAIFFMWCGVVVSFLIWFQTNWKLVICVSKENLKWVWYLLISCVFSLSKNFAMNSCVCLSLCVLVNVYNFAVETHYSQLNWIQFSGFQILSQEMRHFIFWIQANSVAEKKKKKQRLDAMRKIILKLQLIAYKVVWNSWRINCAY